MCVSVCAYIHIRVVLDWLCKSEVLAKGEDNNQQKMLDLVY